MFQLDEQFLQDVGLDVLPDEQKQPFLQHIYEELELRVGTQLSEGLSDAQLDEFESFVSGDADKVQAWLTRYEPNYRDQPAFVKIQEAITASGQGAAGDERAASEYASLRWLEINRPNYRDVVATVLSDLKQELIANREQLLS